MALALIHKMKYISIPRAIATLTLVAAIIAPVSVFYVTTGSLSERQAKTESKVADLTETISGQNQRIEAVAGDAKTAAAGVSILVKVMTGKELPRSEESTTTNYQAIRP